MRLKLLRNLFSYAIACTTTRRNTRTAADPYILSSTSLASVAVTYASSVLGPLGGFTAIRMSLPSKHMRSKSGSPRYRSRSRSRSKKRCWRDLRDTPSRGTTMNRMAWMGLSSRLASSVTESQEVTSWMEVPWTTNQRKMEGVTVTMVDEV